VKGYTEGLQNYSITIDKILINPTKRGSTQLEKSERDLSITISAKWTNKEIIHPLFSYP
jgi:hypothetical protein